MTAPIFRDPGGKPRIEWLDLLKPLRRRRNSWAMIYATTSQSARSHVSRLKRRDDLGGSFEFRSRTQGDRGYVYARYLGR